MRFLHIVGGLSFFIDIGAFIMRRAIDVPVITASVTSFSFTTRGRFRRYIEMLRFLTVVLVGLGLNTLLVWCFVYPLPLDPTAAKIIAVPSCWCGTILGGAG